MPAFRFALEIYNFVKKKLMGYSAITVFLTSICALGLLLVYQIGSNPIKLGNPQDLCIFLGKNPSGPLCEDERRIDLLYDVFPPGVATRSQVRTQLDEFFLNSRSGPASITDTYTLREDFLGTNLWGHFRFDTNGILKDIVAYD